MKTNKLGGISLFGEDDLESMKRTPVKPKNINFGGSKNFIEYMTGQAKFLRDTDFVEPRDSYDYGKDIPIEGAPGHIALEITPGQGTDQGTAVDPQGTGQSTDRSHEKIIELYKQGKSLRTIASESGYSLAVVRRTINKYKESQS